MAAWAAWVALAGGAFSLINAAAFLADWQEISESLDDVGSDEVASDGAVELGKMLQRRAKQANVCVYLYLYLYPSLYIYIHIYIYRERDI